MDAYHKLALFIAILSCIGIIGMIGFYESHPEFSERELQTYLTSNSVDRIALEQGDYAYIGSYDMKISRPLACSENITGEATNIDKFNNRFMFLKP